MQYFRKNAQEVYGYDETDPTQQPHIIAAIEAGWSDITGSWPPAPTAEQVIASYTGAVQNHLDATARARNYDSILSACTYATSTVAKFRAEGQACVDWRDSVWSTCYQLLAAVEAGTQPMPSTPADLVAMLPVMAWPA